MTEPKDQKPSDRIKVLAQEYYGWGKPYPFATGERAILAYLDEQHDAGRGNEPLRVNCPPVNHDPITGYCSLHNELEPCSDCAAQPEPAPGSRRAGARSELCQCSACKRDRMAPGAFMQAMVVCPKCGNKRCPKAAYHGNKCTNSNEPGQLADPDIAEPPAPEAADGLGLLHDRVHVDMPGVRAAISHREASAPEAGERREMFTHDKLRDLIGRRRGDKNCVLILSGVEVDHLISLHGGALRFTEILQQSGDECARQRDAALSQVEELKAELAIRTEGNVLASESLTAATSRAEAAEARAAKLEAELTTRIAQQACRGNGPGGELERAIVVGSVWTKFHGGTRRVVVAAGATGDVHCEDQDNREHRSHWGRAEFLRAHVWVSDPPVPQEPGSEKQ